MLWIPYLVNCLFLFDAVLGVFSCSFSWEHFLWLFILVNIHCLYEFRWNSYLLWSWRGVLNVGVSLYRLHVPNAFSGRAGFDMGTCHLFPQCVPEAITLVVGGAEIEGLELELGVRWDSLSIQCPSTPCQSSGMIPSCWSRSLEFQALLASVLFKCVFPSPYTW